MLKDKPLEIDRGFDAPQAKGPPIPQPVRPSKRAYVVGLVLIVLVALIVFAIMRPRHASKPSPGTSPTSGPGAGRAGAGPVPIVAGTVTQQDVPVYLDGLGTVQAFNAVTVRPRVDGQITQISFQEGQDVRVGDVLAQIDPAPYQAQLDQAVAKRGEDAAQLAVAQVNLKRNAELLASKILSQQEYDTQKALVEQLSAAVRSDDAAVENAKVQLDYTRITSPLEGRVGIRLVDQGNIVRANDQNGIVVIAQLRPISVVFTLPEQQLGQIHAHSRSETALPVLALDRNNRTVLGEGQLSVVDNQIDSTTATIRLKAKFPNEDLRLWPGEFVNARLRLEIRTGGLVVPAQTVQRGPDGPYVFVINGDDAVAVRPVKVGPIENGQASIEEGLSAGERVVIDGQYKLQPGSHVRIGERPPSGPGAGQPAARRPRPGT